MKSVVKATALPVLILSALCFVGLTGRVHAQGTQPKANTNTKPAPTPAATAPQKYEFVAKDGDSMSLFARRALQLYDKDNNGVALSEPGIIYAETNMVMQSNPHLLDVGERVSYPKTLVEQFAAASTKLTADQTAAWQPYASDATFQLDSIQLASAAPAATANTNSTNNKTQSGTTPPPNNAQNNTNTQNQPKDTSKDTTKDTTTTDNKDQAAKDTASTAKPASSTDSSKTNRSAPWYWWLVGAGTLGVLYYILGERGKKRE